MKKVIGILSFLMITACFQVQAQFQNKLSLNVSYNHMQNSSMLGNTDIPLDEVASGFSIGVQYNNHPSWSLETIVRSTLMTKAYENKYQLGGFDFIEKEKAEYHTIDIGFSPKLYFNPRSKLRFYMFSEAQLNINYLFTNTSEFSREGEEITQPLSLEEDDSVINLSIYPGLGLDYTFTNNFGAFVQGGYAFGWYAMPQVQIGARISILKSKSL
ncbi:hypothetical protein [Sediminitomix flava]|uniref:Outer membrane protein with beta-barrel domain n=1 Tax=Sediminitomix flava TaxID=379075 RepID=A0A315ZCE6_SEDFL|nr:hypothetical protein [Sediminitomix flava]PWJ42789.1 hypothetical protein BC781_102335 [Sediminitomix flava]